jgi:YD repeat-containing protein
MTDASGSTKYYYDPINRSNTVTKRVDSVDYTTQYAYDGLGRTKKITYPNPYGNDGEVVRYDYNTGGGLWKVVSETDNTNYAEYTGYNALGQPGNVAYKNGVTTTYTYRLDNNRLQTLDTGKAGQPSLLDLSYEYDNIGNITGITDSTSRPQISFVSENSTYDYRTDHVQPHAMWHNTSAGVTFTYDNNGNMTADGTRTITYDYDNMPSSVTLGSREHLGDVVAI